MAAARFAKRIAQDIQELHQWAAAVGGSCVEETATPVKSGRQFLVRMPGAKDTPYDGCWFNVCCDVPPEFPIKAPALYFRTNIWHPNVSQVDGSVCMDVLAERWSAATKLAQLFALYLMDLMDKPNPDSPLNVDASVQMRADRAKYDAHARELALAASADAVAAADADCAV